MSSTSPLLAYVQTGLLAAVLIVLTLVLLGMSDRPFVPRPAEPPEARAEVLLEPLRRLTATLDSLPQRLAPQGAPASEPRVVVGSPELEKIGAQLARLEQGWRGGAPVAASLERDASRPPAWDAVTTVMSAKRSLEGAEKEAFLRRFFLMHESELLARFGVPTKITVHEGTERWNYDDTAKGLYLDFALHQGRVIKLW
jgi:hypothetical protein